VVGLDRTGVAAGRPQFVTASAFGAGSMVALDEAAVRHLRVLRLGPGALVGVRDGQGLVGEGIVVQVTKSTAHIEVASAQRVEPLPPVHLLVPVADRDRMLWLAEKAAELGATSWRPVLWRRSRSVSPRGEGVGFQGKVRARMEGALAQSEGAWLPQPFPEANLERALLAAPPGDRVVLDPDGAPFVGNASASLTHPLVIAVGPEGGLERDELALLAGAGFRPVSVGPTILRFETAAVAALAAARMVFGTAPSSFAETQPEPLEGT
jgi:16S rRNA (uracil1498-N3)-methyltransferase